MEAVNNKMSLVAEAISVTPCPNSYIYQGITDGLTGKKGLFDYFACFARVIYQAREGRHMEGDIDMGVDGKQFISQNTYLRSLCVYLQIWVNTQA